MLSVPVNREVFMFAPNFKMNIFGPLVVLFAHLNSIKLYVFFYVV